MTEKLSQFLKFWLSGLFLLCPAFLRQLLKEKINQVVILVNNNEFIVNHYFGEVIQPASTKSFNIDNEIDKATMLDFIAEKQKTNATLLLSLPESIVLKRNLSLPLAVKPDIKKALVFELNRKTPFTEDQVYFDFDVTEENNKLNVDLYIVPIDKADPILEKCQSLNLTFDAVSTGKDGSIISNINLVGSNAKKNKNNKTSKLTTLLLACTTALFFTVLYLPLYTQKLNIETLEDKVAEKRNQAVQLQALKKEKNIIFEQSHFLANKRAEQISSIEIINEVTRTIPDDTWLNRLTIRKGVIQLQGESSNASSLLQEIETSDFFENAQFRSPITKNNATKKDRFNLSADILQEKSS